MASRRGWSSLARSVAVTTAGVAGASGWVLSGPVAAISAASPAAALTIALTWTATWPAPLTVGPAGRPTGRRRDGFARERR